MGLYIFLKIWTYTVNFTLYYQKGFKSGSERDWLLKQASDVAPFKSFTWNQPDQMAFPRVKFVSDYVWRCLVCCAETALRVIHCGVICDISLPPSAVLEQKQRAVIFHRRADADSLLCVVILQFWAWIFRFFLSEVYLSSTPVDLLILACFAHFTSDLFNSR